MKLIIASNNRHKIDEIRAMLASDHLDVLSYQEVFPEPIEVEEDGLTFEENALKKVNAYPENPDYIYLADDSGLEVDALNGAPGIYSARYAGPHATYMELCQKLLFELNGQSNRSAQFRSTIALRYPGHQYDIVNGIVRGQIIHDMRGTQGFGYDPLFVPQGETLTFAELSSEQKNKISHRYLALVQATEKLHQWLSLKNSCTISK